MKIIGLGTDIVKINRLKKIFIKNSSFKKRVFSKNEIIYCEKKKTNASCYAKRFAAKEAFSKALGTGISKGLNFNEIIIFNTINGAPFFKIYGDSLKIVNKILKSKKYKIYLSLTDEDYYALATVIITK